MAVSIAMFSNRNSVYIAAYMIVQCNLCTIIIMNQALLCNVIINQNIFYR